jgi:hypothetical protein
MVVDDSGMTLPAKLSDLCACGLPLHYTDPAVREMIERTVARGGEFVKVYSRHRVYLVQRHYMALHGLPAARLEELAAKGIIERLEPK